MSPRRQRTQSRDGNAAATLSAAATFDALPSPPSTSNASSPSPSLSSSPARSSLAHQQHTLAMKGRAISLRRPPTLPAQTLPRLSQQLDVDALRSAVAAAKQRSSAQLRQFTADFDDVAEKPVRTLFDCISFDTRRYMHTYSLFNRMKWSRKFKIFLHRHLQKLKWY
jgi:hypothetical protein